ncbi:MAG: hypothetical protein ACRELS_19825 [Candidatus Rokuibacteriota bacterium]
MNEKGIALPTALIVLSVLLALVVAFLVLAASEPQIAYNQMASAQARAVAETGVERALWALTKGDSNPDPPFTLDTTNLFNKVAPPDYDGSKFIKVAPLGAFKVTVTDGPTANQKVITAVGFFPNEFNPTAIKKIQVRVIKFKKVDPPCALCAGGESPPGTTTQVQVGGNATVNASPAKGANYCAGVTPTSAVASDGSVKTNGSPNLSEPTDGATIAENVPKSTFEKFILTDTDMAFLKSFAKANGTYFQGDTTFTEAPKNGVVFIDTPSGQPFTASSPTSDQISVDMHGNWGSPGFSGWVVVAGSAKISGNVTITGLVYAQNDVSLNGLGTSKINGAVISTNRKDTSATTVDSSDIGQAPLTYDCPAVRTGGGSLPQGWTIEPGTFVEQAGK